jgi:hypothetical protein
MAYEVIGYTMSGGGGGGSISILSEQSSAVSTTPIQITAASIPSGAVVVVGLSSHANAVNVPTSPNLTFAQVAGTNPFAAGYSYLYRAVNAGGALTSEVISEAWTDWGGGQTSQMTVWVFTGANANQASAAAGSITTASNAVLSASLSVSANSYLVMVGLWTSVVTVSSLDAGTTQLAYNNTDYSVWAGRSTAAVSAGTQSLGVTASAAGNRYGAILEILA